MEKSHTKDNMHTKHSFVYSFLFKQMLAFPNVSLREEALSPSPPSLTESVGYFRHRGLFDQTPTTLRSFLTSLTSNVWHSRLAADQLSAPRRGPIGPGQMPLHVGPDHMNRGQAGAPRELPHPHTVHCIASEPENKYQKRYQRSSETRRQLCCLSLKEMRPCSAGT